MSAIALDPLIAEAQRRARRRRLLLTALLVVGGGAVATFSLARGGRPSAPTSRVSIPAGATGLGCGIRGVGDRILNPDGQTLYREPGAWAHPARGFPAIQCSGSTIWAVWFNGVWTGNEGYVGARSSNHGRTWRLVFSNPPLGVKKPHALANYLGVWALRGPNDAYFTGLCPFCSSGKLQGTVSLWVTKDGGSTFRVYKVPALTGFEPRHLRIARDAVTISGTAFVTGVASRKTVTLHLG